MRRLLTLLLVAVIGLISVPAAQAMEAAGPAREAAAEARAFRAGITAQLARELTTYRERLSPAERARMRTLERTMDRDLAALQRVTATTARLAARPDSRPQAHRSAQRAVAQFDAGYAKAMTSLAELQPMLLPRMSILEALRAKSDLDAQLARFAALGERIRAVERVLRP